MIDAAKIEELRGLDAAATPGPWSQWGENHSRIQDAEGRRVANVGGWEHPWKPDDGRSDQMLIVAMRNALPELLDLAASLAREGEDGLCEALTSYQQADEDGVMVLVSRQACDEAATRLRALASEKEGLRRERDEARAAAAFIADEGTYQDSYGVPGSGFSCCRFCEAGGAPGVPFVHNPRCPILRCEEVAEDWWSERKADADENKGLRIRAESSEALVAELREKVERLTKALLRLQNGAAVALNVIPEDQQEGVVGNFLAAIHRECCAGLSAGQGADECKGVTP